MPVDSLDTDMKSLVSDVPEAAARVQDRDASLLVLDGLRKCYGPVEALRGVDLEIARGEIVALLGRNGAGKTTLISIVAGLLAPDAGKVWLDGMCVRTQAHLTRRLVGLAPQETGVYPTLSVGQNLRYFGEIAGLRRSALTRRSEEVACALELAELLGTPARELSGGERRRLHTAIALIHRPQLLLLDEPTMGADAQTRKQVVEVVRSLAKEGSAVCYSTHYLGEVDDLGASVAVLDGGRFVAHGSVSSLIARHGESMVELCFDGPAPSLDCRQARVVGDNLQIVSDRQPAAELVAILAELGSAARRLKSVQLIQPSLESVFLKLTDCSLPKPDREVLNDTRC
jgi:ABC-2 type transport system ATP-binding protein